MTRHLELHLDRLMRRSPHLRTPTRRRTRTGVAAGWPVEWQGSLPRNADSRLEYTGGSVASDRPIWNVVRRGGRGWALGLVAAAALASTVAPACARPSETYPGTTWQSATPASAGIDPVRLGNGVAYARKFGGAGLVVRGGRIIARWGDTRQRYDIKSSTKSFGSLLLGLAIADGRLGLETKANSTFPGFGTPPSRNTGTGWLRSVTIRHLATHTAGFDKPGGFNPLLFKPGTAWAYSDGGANWLGDILTTRFKNDLASVLRARILKPIGVGRSSLTWIANQYRSPTLNGVTRRTISSGIHTDADTLARIGLLVARGGRWRSRQVVPASYVRALSAPPAGLAALKPFTADLYPGATRHYSLLFWLNSDGVLEGLPKDAVWSWGLFDSLIVAVPSLDLVIARVGPTMEGGNKWGSIQALRPFLNPIGSAVRR